MNFEQFVGLAVMNNLEITSVLTSISVFFGTQQVLVNNIKHVFLNLNTLLKSINSKFPFNFN